MPILAIEDFKWGIEHEFPLLKNKNTFCDFTNLSFSELAGIIEKLPVFTEDYPSLRVGDLGIKTKRWYIEGFERFNEEGKFLYAVPKGVEIRTPVCNTLNEAVEILRQDLSLWEEQAKAFGYTSAKVAFNPFLSTEFAPEPPENAWEIKERYGTAEYLHMLTYGPDINISHPALGSEELIDVAKKLTFYSPYIVPFSFSSPFYKGELWNGLSRRTYYRTGRRPAVAVFLNDEKSLIKSIPPLIKKARVNTEIGRIEFKAFDLISDLKLYESLGVLLLGMILEDNLPGRLLVPDQRLHQESALHGFDNPNIRFGAEKVIKAVKVALPSSLHSALMPLEMMLETRKVAAHNMIEVYNHNKNIIEVISY